MSFSNFDVVEPSETVAEPEPLWNHEDMVALRREDIEKLPVEERLQLIEEVWETIRENPDALPLTDAQRAELDRRLAAHDADPRAARDLDEVLTDLRNPK